MAGQPQPDVAIDDEDGRRLAAADVDLSDEAVARACLHVEAGHIPPGTRTRLVDAVLDTPEVAGRRHVQVALPLGDSEILERVRQRCKDTNVRAAGATCLIEGAIPEQRPRAD